MGYHGAAMPLEWDSTSLGIPQYVTDLNKRGEKTPFIFACKCKRKLWKKLIYIHIYISTNKFRVWGKWTG